MERLESSTAVARRRGEGREVAFARRLDAARGGSRAAQEALFRHCYPRVERIVHAQLRRGLGSRRGWLASRFSTADVVQEVFRTLVADLAAFRGASEGEFMAYLVTLVRRRALDAVRHHGMSCRDYRRSVGPSDADPDLAAPARAEDDPCRETASSLEARYRAALASFPPETQSLLRARIERRLGFDALAREEGFPSRYAARRAYFAAQAKLSVRLGLGRD